METPDVGGGDRTRRMGNLGALRGMGACNAAARLAFFIKEARGEGNSEKQVRQGVKRKGATVSELADPQL